MNAIRALVRQLHDDMQQNETRPSVEEITQRLREIDAQLLLAQTRSDAAKSTAKAAPPAKGTKSRS